MKQKIVSLVIVLAVIGLILWGLSLVYHQDQKPSIEGRVALIENYLNGAIQLGVFPSGQQLSTIAQQRASTTKK